VERFIVSVDFGRDRDPTAIAVSEVIERQAAEYKIMRKGIIEQRSDMIAKSLMVSHLEQVELKTSYVEVINRLNELLSHPRLVKRCGLVVDATGMGAPLVDMLKAHGLAPIGVTLTAGENENQSPMGYRVPKLVVVDSIQALLHTQRLAISDAISKEMRDKLMEQMREFVMKNSASGHQGFEARLERIHDDLVIALGLGCWWFVRQHGQSMTRAPAGDMRDRKRYNPHRRRNENAWHQGK
jgi:hypothetical protein